jgi:hypothetical protein
MLVGWDVPVEMDDGLVLRADVFRPMGDGQHPVLLSYGPYGKDVHFADHAPGPWESLAANYPDSRRDSSHAYQCWELPDPERWVPDGYVCVRVDSRGAGRSPGFLDPWSERETRDLYDCIEWAGTQGWSNGRVGLNGVSYYSMNQWQVAALNPPHLAAMCAWEGASDIYRELFYHGGILSTFAHHWYTRLVAGRQHGLGVRGPRSRVTGALATGPASLTPEALAANRSDFLSDAASHPLFDEYWRSRVPDLAKIEVPLLAAGNWGGQGLHLRGGVEGYMKAGSTHKWLEIHGAQHWAHFYTDYGVALQKRFFGHFLKGEDTGWDSQPPVVLQVRHPGERFEERSEQEWPPARTEMTRRYLHPSGDLVTEAPEDEQTVTYEALGEGITFLTPPLKQQLEITGHPRAKIWLSSDTNDADVFLILRVFAADMSEVTFIGSNDPHTPIAHGWLRASHRTIDADGYPHRPHHPHSDRAFLEPGDVYELDVEIWPTSIVVPAGYRIGLSLRGRDYVSPRASPQPVPLPGTGTSQGFEGVGPFRHIAPENRSDRAFHGEHTIHWSRTRASFIDLPVIPR